MTSVGKIVSELAYRTTGPEQAPVVLLLHGFMGSAADWDEVVVGLSAGYRCVAVDLPGQGASVGLPDMCYTMAGAARGLLGVLDAVGAEQADVVGYSMGGRLALFFALHHAARCRRLVLESASPGLRQEAGRAARRKVDEARAVRLETEDFEAFLADWYRMPLFATLHRHPGLVERLTRARRRNVPAELARVLRGMGTGRQPSLWERLAVLQVSTLAVAGALDVKYAEIAERMAVQNPLLHAAVVPNVGHTVHAEHPGAFIDILKDFLKQP